MHTHADTQAYTVLRVVNRNWIMCEIAGRKFLIKSNEFINGFEFNKTMYPSSLC